MTWLVPILEALLRALIPALRRSGTPTAEDSRPQPELRERLQQKVRRHWGAAAMVLLLLMAVGCAPRTVYVPSGEPVRLRETVRNAKVWVLDSEGRPVAGRMDLPAGWYVLADEE